MNHDTPRLIGEGISLGLLVGALVQWLPPLVSLCALAWYGVLFYDRFKKKQNESKTKEN
jgi:hypothetical protein